MLKLRRGTVTRADPLRVRVDAEERAAWADEGMVGPVLEGDEVIVNTEALDLGLGSGGYDVVHVNLTRGLDAPGSDVSEAMKLNYTSLQHPVDPVEAWEDTDEDALGNGSTVPVLVLALHGQLAPATWAARRRRPDLRVGYVQTEGGALPAGLSRDVAELRTAELLCGHVTAGAAYGGEQEALTTIGALRAAVEVLGWDAVVVGPGPGIAGSHSELGHGGMAALEAAHASLILGYETLLAPRMSSGDSRPRHQGVSHHTRTVLRMLLGNVRVPAPAARTSPWPRINGGDVPLEQLREACGGRHELWVRKAPLDEYGESGLPADHMGRGIAEDPLFFSAALAAGDGLAAAARTERASV
jgi:Protein of unknown function (DUF3866)